MWPGRVSWFDSVEGTLVERPDLEAGSCPVVLLQISRQFLVKRVGFKHKVFGWLTLARFSASSRRVRV